MVLKRPCLVSHDPRSETGDTTLRALFATPLADLECTEPEPLLSVTTETSVLEAIEQMVQQLVRASASAEAATCIMVGGWREVILLYTRILLVYVD